MIDPGPALRRAISRLAINSQRDLLGIDAPKIASFLWDKYRIIVPGIVSGRPPAQRFDFQGVRVTPDIYTPLEEVDTFARAMEELAAVAP